MKIRLTLLSISAILLLGSSNKNSYSTPKLPVMTQKVQDRFGLSVFGTEIKTTCGYKLQERFLYMFKTEISNLEYKEYLFWLKKHKTETEYNAALPDTQVWRSKYAYNEPYTEYYFQHPVYSDYPVVGVSQQQARGFCAWLQDILNDYFRQSKDTEIEEVIVRLPSSQEWMMAARSGLSDNAIFPWESESERWRKEGKKRQRGMMRLNFSRGNGEDYGGISSHLNDPGITAPVKSYWPNKIGLYNMCGNVAEWVEESGKTKGGAWSLPLYYSRIDSEGFWDGDSAANSSIGFRHLVEVVKFKTQKPLTSFVLLPKYFIDNFKFVPQTDTSANLLFAEETEVSNKQYLQFLMENPDTSLRIRHENWELFFRYKWYAQYGQNELFYDYPLVNISYEAATKYCEWLTKKYNAMHKRQHKRVVFRLPTSAEWELAARGGRIGNTYPWGGPYKMNYHGCYLANFFPLEERFLKMDTLYNQFYDYPNNDKTISRGLDGGIIPVNVNSYFPNDYGIYNMSGNVAEMVQEKGISKGGSWNSFLEYIAIASHETYVEANPTLGFRVFMEVLEE